MKKNIFSHLGVLTIKEERLKAVKEDEDELDHLERGQILLPPEVLLHLRPQGGQQVVKVHDRVDAGVKEGAESALAAADEPATSAKITHISDLVFSSLVLSDIILVISY